MHDDLADRRTTGLPRIRLHQLLPLLGLQLLLPWLPLLLPLLLPWLHLLLLLLLLLLPRLLLLLLPLLLVLLKTWACPGHPLTV